MANEPGLPDELPPIRLPDLATLAQQARASALLARVRGMAEWIDGRHVSVTHDGLLSAGHIAIATQDFDLSANEIEFLWDLATELEFVETREDQVLLGPGLEDWPGGSDEMAIEVWGAAFDFVLTAGAWYEEDPDDDADLDDVGPAAVFGLFVAGEYGMPREKLSQLVREGLGGPGEDPVPAVLERLRELGAVETEGTVRLTPLAFAVVRESYVEMGIDVPVLPLTGQLTAADLLVAGPVLPPDAFDHEFRAWLAPRGPDEAGKELARAAAAGDAVERMFAVHLIRSTELGTEQLWRFALDLPEVRPYAKTELREPPDIAEVAWLLTDTLAATGDVEESFLPAVPAGSEQEIFDAMWRLPHPEAKYVLTMIGEDHPDKKIAKAARKAAFKARS